MHNSISFTSLCMQRKIEVQVHAKQLFQRGDPRMNTFMERAWAEAKNGMQAGDGGPFGAVVVKDGQVVSAGHNQVLANHDSTAHAEIVAIRKAEKIMATHDLSTCSIYTTCYPCPMCLSAILWARIKTVFYGCTMQQAAAIGFDDQVFYDAVCDPENSSMIEMMPCEQDTCLTLFSDWQKMDGREMY
jgi:guanine deaminase